MVRVAVVTTLTAFLMSGCCSEEQTDTPPAPIPAPSAEVKSDPVPAVAQTDPVAEAGGDDAEAEAAAKDDELPPALGEEGAEPLPPQEPVDILYELEADKVGDKLELAGWKLDGGAAKIDGGNRFEASKDKGKVKIELVNFETNELADKYMYKIEKNKDAVLGRNNTKMVAVIPGKGTTQTEANSVLQTLMAVPKNPTEMLIDPETGEAADGAGGAVVPAAPADGPAAGVVGEEGGAAPPGGEEVPTGEMPK